MSRFILLCLLCTTQLIAAPQIINYQGFLADSSGVPVDTMVTMTFRLYPDSASGDIQWSETRPVVPVIRGQFRLAIGAITPFGETLFDSPQSWLGVTIGDDSELEPRIPLASAPYAQRVNSVNGAKGGQLLGNVQIQGKGNVGWGNFNGDSAFVLGIADTARGAFSVVLGGHRNLALDSFCVVTGGEDNIAGNDSIGALLTSPGRRAWCGGGRGNVASGDYSVVCGGSSNTAAGERSVVSGGGSNYAEGSSSVIAGGYDNSLYNVGSTISGGWGNTMSTLTGLYCTIGGGFENTTSGWYNTISGGNSNTIGAADYITIGGGSSNGGGNDYATVGGGNGNNADGQNSTVSGGGGNSANEDFSAIGGGAGNNVTGAYSAIFGGHNNVASGDTSYIGAGEANLASGNRSTIGGGQLNVAGLRFSSIGGGYQNSAIGNGEFNTIAGGTGNLASGAASSIGGGLGNEASGFTATVPGGFRCKAMANETHAIGRSARANHVGSFVWGSGTNVLDSTASFGDYTFTARAPGGVRFYTTSNTLTGVELPPGGGSWAMTSDRNAKENFERVNTRDILERVSRLDISSWNYKSQEESIRHIGPMAQDFYNAFKVGESNTAITSVDADGVLLAAVQELLKRNLALEERVKQLEMSDQQFGSLTGSGGR